MRVSPREELLLELFRELHVDQRNDIIRSMRALKDANKITLEAAYNAAIKSNGGPKVSRAKSIKLVPDARVEMRFGAAPIRETPRSSKPQPRRPDRNQDDAEPEI